MQHVFERWADLFAVGPQVLTLSISWRPTTHDVVQIEVERDEVVQQLYGVAELARQVAEGDSDLYILHLGI